MTAAVKSAHIRLLCNLIITKIEIIANVSESVKCGDLRFLVQKRKSFFWYRPDSKIHLFANSDIRKSAPDVMDI